jgi:hypothetical protein
LIACKLDQHSNLTNALLFHHRCFVYMFRDNG